MYSGPWLGWALCWTSPQSQGAYGLVGQTNKQTNGTKREMRMLRASWVELSLPEVRERSLEGATFRPSPEGQG